MGTSPFPQPQSLKTRLIAVVYKSLFLFSIIHLYCISTSFYHKCGGVVASITFILIETVWTTFADENQTTGVVTIGWNGRLGHSSFAQFWSNIIFTPMLLFTFQYLVSNHILRIILFPFNIWWLEIIEGYTLMFLFGKNVAWEYRGSDAFCHGNIKLRYFLPWLVLGAIVEFAWDIIITPAIEQIVHFNAYYYILLIATVVTLLLSPRMGIVGIWKSLIGHKFDWILQTSALRPLIKYFELFHSYFFYFFTLDILYLNINFE